MDLFLLISKKDVASENIGRFLDKKFFEDIGVEVIETEKLHLYLTDEDIEEMGIKGPILVLSSHASEMGVKSLTVHTPGNFSENLFGGEKRKLSYANPILQSVLLKELYAKNPFKDFRVSLEVTHHGPTIDAPVTFYEVGSSEKEWRDEEVCKFMAKILKSAIPKYFDLLEKDLRICFGVGGPHYAPNFTRKVIKENMIIGHIMPKYNFNPEMFPEMVMKNFPKRAEVCVIDWKGLNGEQRRSIVNYCRKNSIEVIKI